MSEYVVMIAIVVGLGLTAVSTVATGVTGMADKVAASLKADPAVVAPSLPDFSAKFLKVGQ